MTLHSVRRDDNAQEESLAALLLLVSAQSQDGSSIKSLRALVERWRELKQVLKEDP